MGFTQNIVLVPFQQAEATVAWALRHIVSLRATLGREHVGVQWSRGRP